MLRLNKIISFSKKEKRHLKFLKKKFGGKYTVDTWDDGTVKTAEIKNKISFFLHTNQKFRCVYCEKSLIREKKEIDHIAPKHLNPEFTFTPLNLAYACGYCNGSDNKGMERTIVQSNINYKRNQFSIVHPYLDNPDIHIRYTDPEKIYLNLPRCSAWGINTIYMFKLNDEEMVNYRARELKLQRDNPIDDLTLKEIILNAVSYKKK